MGQPSKSIDLSVRIHTEDAVEDFKTVEEAGNRVLETIDKLQKQGDKSLAGTKEFYRSAIDNAHDSLEFIKQQEDFLSSRNTNEYDKKNSTLSRSNSVEELSVLLQDVHDFTRAQKTVSRLKNAIPQVLEFLPQLFQMATNAANLLVGSGNLPSDQQLRAAIQTQTKYQNWIHNTGKINAQQEKDLLQYAVLRAVPQIQRLDYIKKINPNRVDSKHVFDSFNDMLPEAFRQANTNRRTIGRGPASNMQYISSDERQALKDLLLHNAYAMQAADRIGLTRRENGDLYLRGGINRGLVNALGGEIFKDIEIAAKGMRMYGITDVNDPDMWDKIERKNNKQLMASMSAARSMQEAFGWMQAGHYSDQYIDKLRRNSAVNQGDVTYHKIGEINHAPILRRYEVAKYTLDDLAHNRNWNDGKTFDDEHHFAIDESLHLNNIMRHGSGIKGHNEYLDDVIYVDIDKRLGDINLDQEERRRIEQQYAELFENGISGKGRNSRGIGYSFTRINAKSGAEFVRNDIIKKILKEDPTYFSAGLDQDTFYTWKEFASAMEYRNKNATPGQDIRKLFGSDLPMKIAVVDLKDTTKGTEKGNDTGTGLNGASIISNRLVRKGFQGRTHGIKTALSPMDIRELVNKYGGNLTLKALTGTDTEKDKRIAIDDDVDMIINAADIKNAGNRFKGMTNAEITQEVLKDIQRYGITAKTTYADANTKTRWISGQLAQTMSMNPTESAMFARAFLDEYRKAGDYQYAVEHIFGRDAHTKELLLKDPELFGSRHIQSRIADYRKSIMAKMLRGDLLLPKGINAYKAMAAPWVIDAFNADMRKAGEFDKLPEEVKRELNQITLGDNRALFLNTLATRLGFSRYPATGRSLQAVNNARTDDEIREVASKLGLDPNAVYISTTSPLMQLLQDADFDGDVLELLELNNGRKKSNSVTKIMEKIVQATMINNEKLYANGRLTEEQLQKRDEALKGTAYADDKYSTKKGQRGMAIAKWLSAYALQSSSMGTPNATIRNAYQMDPDSEVIQAIIDAERQYSENSTTGKKGKYRKTSKEQSDIMSQYKPFSEFYRMVDKSRDDRGRINPELLKEKNFYAVNLPSAHMSGSMRSQMLAAYMAQQMGYNPNQAYDWEEIFEIAHGKRDTTTAVGRMQAALRDLDIARLEQRFIVPSDKTVANLMELEARAVQELIGQYSAKRSRGELSAKEMRQSDETLARNYLKSRGGNAIDNLTKYTLVEDKLPASQNNILFGQLRQFGFEGIGDLDFSEYLDSKGKTIQEIYQDANAKAIAERDEKIRQLSVLDKEQLTKSINELRISPSSIQQLIKNPIEWATDRLARDPNMPSPDRSNVASLLGNYSHNAIEAFMMARAKYNVAHGQAMSADDLQKAADEALALFDSLAKGTASEEQFDGLRRLTKSETNSKVYKDMYKGIRSFLSDGLLKLFPDDEYEVAAIENMAASQLGSGISREKAGLKFKLGKKIGSDEDIESTGFFDLLFKRRGTNEYTMADIKNYLNPTSHDKALWKMQQLLYAQVMPDYIKDVIGDENGTFAGIEALLPIQGTRELINSSPEAVKAMQEKWQQAIALIQAMPEIGISTPSLMQLGKSLDDLFTSNEFSGIANEVRKSEEQAAQVKAQLEGQNGQAFGGALLLHDNYNQAMGVLNGINKFVRGQQEQTAPGSFNSWSSNYYQLQMLQDTINSLRGQGMDAQANMLETQMEKTQANLDAILPQSAVKDLTTVLDLLKAINNEEQSDKATDSRIDYFQQLTAKIKEASHAYDMLQEKIEQNEQKIQENEKVLKGIDTAAGSDDERLKKQEEVTKLTNENEKLRKENETNTAQAKEADKQYQALKQQQDRFNTKVYRDTWNTLDAGLEQLQKTQAGEIVVSESSIMDEVLSFDKSIGTQIANAKKYAEEDMIDEDDEKYVNYIKSLQSMRSSESLDNYRHMLTQRSLDEFSLNRSKVAGRLPGMHLSEDVQIKAQVEAQKHAIQMELARIDARFKDVAMNPSEQSELQKLKDYYAQFSESAYEEYLKEQIKEQRWSEGMQMQQQEHRADQALYSAEHMRRGRRTRYNTTMLSRMYMDRENMAHQASEEEWNYRQEEERMRHQLEGLRSQRAGIDESDTAAIGEIDRKIESAEQSMRKYAAAADEAKSRQSELGNQMPILGAAFDTIAQSVSRVTQQLGRRIFQKAIQEAKRFVMEFDASMTEIQTITMKSDEQMQDIRSSTIDRAINLRTSVGDVSRVEADLYRQGLSDAEVADRSEAIIKFATVTGSKVTDATKIITSALQNGLVQSAEEAMDALTALGDNAATTAVEIGKAMQKCAAAAKVAGVSYGELTSMITVMTSTTQLSGTQVGTALNTLFSRLRQVQSTGYVSDKNGDTTDLSTIETALRLAGIDLRSDQNTFRTPTEIMYDIARNWGDLSDVQRANITTSVAGVRAGNMFSTLMEGMAEDNGETFAKYLGLSEDSEGITGKKYEIAVKSLQASINELKSTFDGLVESLINSGTVKSIIDFITSIVRGIKSLVDNGQGLIGVIMGVGTAIATVMALIKGGPFGAIMAAITGIAGVAITGAIGNSINSNSKQNVRVEREQAVQTYVDNAEKRYGSMHDLIDETDTLIKRYEMLNGKLSAGDEEKLNGNIDKLTATFGDFGTSVDETATQLQKWRTIIDGAKESVSTMEAKTQSVTDRLAQNAFQAGYQARKQEYADSWSEEHSLGFTKEDIAIDEIRKEQEEKLEEIAEREKPFVDTPQEIVDNYIKLHTDAANAMLTVRQKAQNKEQAILRYQELSDKVQSSEFEIGSDVINSLVDDMYTLANNSDVDHTTRDQAQALLAELIDENGRFKNESDAAVQMDRFIQEYYKNNLPNSVYESRLPYVSYQEDLNKLSAQITQAANELDIAQAAADEAAALRNAAYPRYLYYSKLNEKIERGDDVSASEYMGLSLQNSTIMKTMMDQNQSSFLNQMQMLYYDNPDAFYTNLNEDYEHITEQLGGRSLSLVSWGDLESLLTNYIDVLGEGALSWLGDTYVEAIEEGGFLYEALEATAIEWNDFLLGEFDQFFKNPQLNIDSSDQVLMKAMTSAATEAINQAVAESGQDIGEWMEDPNKVQNVFRQVIDDYNTATAYGKNRLDYKRKYAPDELSFSVGDLKFETLEEAKEYVENGELMQNGLWVKAHNFTLEDILENGNRYYQSPQDVFEGLWQQYQQENPDLSGKRLDLLNIANGATGFQEFMSGISDTLGVTWARDNMSKVLPKELYSALQATSEGTLDWPIFQQMLQNYQLGQKGYGYDSNRTILTGEGGIGATFMSALQSNDQAGMLAEYQRLSGDAVSFDVFKTALESYDGGSEILDKLSRGAQITEEDIQKLNNAIGRDGAAALGNWSKAMERGRQNVEQLTGEASDVHDFFNGMNSAMTKVSQNQWFRNQWTKGNRSKQTLEAVAQQTGFSLEQLQDQKWLDKNGGLVSDMLDKAEKADLQSVQNYGDTIAQAIQDQLNNGTLAVDGVNLTADGTTSVDLSGIVKATAGDLDAQTKSIIDLFNAWGINARLRVETEGEGDGATFKTFVEIDDASLANLARRPKGGGGGGGKSHAQQLIESQKHSASVDDHMLKMIQYRRTRYKNAGELTNENTLIKQENEERRRQIKNQRDNISALRDEMAATEQGSDDWYALRDAIQAAEEAIQEHTQAIRDNLEQMKENRKQIRQYKVDIQDMISAELDNREELRRQRLQGTVDMENTILDLIKQRYLDEWDLLKQDIENKKSALEQEKSLIDERLNARKNAASEASKYEELANLQAQLSRVEMDSSRTREAAELRDKIAKLQDEIAWKIADQEADAQKADLDERIMGYDLYTDQYQEWLDNYLEDNNNFTTELNDVLKKSREDLIEWLKENDKTYADSTKEQQELMVQNWGDMYDEMKGLTDQYWRDYWNQVAAVMTDRESFMDFMMDSEEYRTASNDRKRQLREQWNEAWSLWSTAKLGGAALVSDEHAGEHGDDIDDEPKYKFKRSWEVIKKNGSVRASGVAEGDAFYTKKYAKLAAKQLAEEQAMDRKHVGDKVKYGKVEKAYAQGGLVDFTGPAWVDGSKTKPEAFLSAEDTAAMRAFLDAFSTIRVPSFSSMISDSMFSDVSGFTVESLNIEIKEAELKDDADYEEVARKVGEEFVRELSKQGLQTANFAFSS